MLGRPIFLHLSLFGAVRVNVAYPRNHHDADNIVEERACHREWARRCTDQDPPQVCLDTKQIYVSWNSAAGEKYNIVYLKCDFCKEKSSLHILIFLKFCNLKKIKNPL